MAENIYIEPELKIYKNNKVHDLSEFVQSIQVTKSLRNPVGAFNVVLNPTITNKGRITLLTNKIYNEINSMLAVNDVIAGKINKRSQRHSFLGLTSSHYESVTQMNNQISRVIVVTGGFALPKLLIRDSIVSAPSLAVTPEIQNDPVLRERAQFFKFMRGIKDGKSPYLGTPEDVVKYILNNAVATNIKIYDGKNVKSLFPPPAEGKKDYSGNPLSSFKFLGREFIYGETLSTFSGPIMNYIYECLDKEFYELFFDTTTGEDGLPYNTMTIRTKPFSHREIDEGNNYFYNWAYWEDLANEAVTVKSEDVFQREIGKNDFELKNFFRVNYNKVLIAQALGPFGLNYPILNINSIKRHGLRALEIDSTILIDVRPIIQEHNQAIGLDSVRTFTQLITEFARESAAALQGLNKLTLANMMPKSKHVTLANVDKQSPPARSFGDELFRGLLSKRNKIKEWYAFPYYESGSLRTVYNEEITIGRLINLPEYEYYFPLDEKIYKGIKLYATDVTHIFQWGQIAETRVNVTNGQADGVVKAWFDHQDNKFTESPLTTEQPAIGQSFDKEFFDSLPQMNKDMLTIKEIPNG